MFKIKTETTTKKKPTNPLFASHLKKHLKMMNSLMTLLHFHITHHVSYFSFRIKNTRF